MTTRTLKHRDWNPRGPEGSQSVIGDGYAGYAAATLRATSKSSSGIGTGRRHVNATGRSPR